MTSLISLVKSALSTFSDSVNEHNYKGTLTGSLFLCYNTAMKRSPGEIMMHPLWLMPVFVGCLFLMIESLHTMAHLKMNLDVHGYCMQNKEHLERQDDDW